jgi:SRSO17 transposase
VAVTLTYATGRGHALIGRALYLPEPCAADEEHRELAGVPEEVMSTSKPQPAGDLLDRAHAAGIRASFVAGDEVYGGGAASTAPAKPTNAGTPTPGQHRDHKELQLL